MRLPFKRSLGLAFLIQEVALTLHFLLILSLTGEEQQVLRDLQSDDKLLAYGSPAPVP